MSNFEGIPSLDNQKLNPNETDTTVKIEKRQEIKEVNEDLKENDLIVADDDLESAKKILEENKIQYKYREYTKRLVIDTPKDTAIPGEFILTIFDPEYPNRPANFDFVKQVLEFIKQSNIPVRYGRIPRAQI